MLLDGVVDMKSNGTSMSKWHTVNVTGSSKEAIVHNSSLHPVYA